MSSNQKNIAMKKLHPILYLFCLSILFSCTEEDNVVDQVFDGVSNGAVLRGTIIENEIPVGVEDAKFVLDIEEQDIEEGALLWMAPSASRSSHHR